MKTFGERLLFALEQVGMSQSELARVVGIKPQSVQYLCTSSNAGTRSKYATEIAITLNVRSEWLLSGEEPMEIDDLAGAAQSPMEDRLASSPNKVQILIDTILDMSEAGTLTEGAASGLLIFLEAMPAKKTAKKGHFEKLRRRVKDAGRTAR